MPRNSARKMRTSIVLFTSCSILLAQSPVAQPGKTQRGSNIAQTGCVCLRFQIDPVYVQEYDTILAKERRDGSVVTAFSKSTVYRHTGNCYPEKVIRRRLILSHCPANGMTLSAGTWQVPASRPQGTFLMPVLPPAMESSHLPYAFCSHYPGQNGAARTIGPVLGAAESCAPQQRVGPTTPVSHFGATVTKRDTPGPVRGPPTLPASGRESRSNPAHH